MSNFTVIFLVCCVTLSSTGAITSEEETDLIESCCSHGETFAFTSSQCEKASTPEEVESSEKELCITHVRSCCEKQVQLKNDCDAGIKLGPSKKCSRPKTDIGKTCCDECTVGILTGESQGFEACGDPADQYVSPSTRLRNDAFYKCCFEAAKRVEEMTTTKIIETTTEIKVETTTKKRDSCKTKNPCEHECDDKDGIVTCRCHDGYRLQADKKSCKDINECAEYVEDLCPEEGTVCHNLPGSFKCVPLRKRDVSHTCPPGFKRNVENQVCDDINECQLPRPPCLKYLCENTIGGFNCAGKPGKPEPEPRTTTPTTRRVTTPKSNMCPPGFRDGPEDDCADINECEERLDDCQRLSQHCINSHGSFFCQDHVSKRCAPGFVINRQTGVCEDINECEDNPESCRRDEICINLPGAYDCKSKISTLPKLSPKKCQEGTRMRPGGTICEDIDECREGTHLCDQFQDCINTYGGHECRCKNGFELDSTTSSCVDIDECVRNLDNCVAGLYCLNVLGSFTCTRQLPATTPAITSTTTSTTTHSPDEYEYYYTDDDGPEEDSQPAPPSRTPVTHTSNTMPTPSITSRATTPRPTIRRPVPTRPSSTIPVSTTQRPMTTTPVPTYKSTTAPITTTKRTTTPRPVTTTQEATTITESTTTPAPPPIISSTTSRPRTSPRQRPPRPNTMKPPPPPPLPPRPSDDTSRFPELTNIPAPVNPDIVERDKDANGTYSIDTEDIPTDRWTNVIGKDPKPDSDFDIINLHCLNGYEKNERGECVDIDECATGHYICSNLEFCKNQPGGYTCDCITGFERDPSGWCAVIPTPTAPSTERTTTAVASTPSTTPEWAYPPYKPRADSPPLICELGYEFVVRLERCVDIDECSTGKASCSADEDCVNHEGGYKCVCGQRCREANNNPRHEVGRPNTPATTGSNVITVGSQYGQRGPRHMRPTYTRRPDSGTITISCPWGYKLNDQRRCLDIDECDQNTSQCSAEQTCQNFFGGYSCQCPAGHKLGVQNRCEDINECEYSNTCSILAKCVNTVGSYQCECSPGFRNAPSNERVCVDVDECEEQPGLCQQGCVNAWGDYRCTCNKGYQLHTDNRTCVDIDECAQAEARMHRGRLCVGECINTDGSYKCACPAGYRTSTDGRSCIDLNECETGEATCARGAPGEICQNIRGSYHCHKIDCPPGYRLDGKHVCKRIQEYCSINDHSCISRPSSYSYNFITFVSNIYLPSGSVDLFTIHGTQLPDSILDFELAMMNVQASPGVQPARLSCFEMRPSARQCTISLLCSLAGPQVAELELTMSVYQRGQFIGNMVARIVVIVSQYSF